MKIYRRPFGLLPATILLGWVAATAANSYAEEQILDLDATRSRVDFVLPGSLHTVHGNFKLKSGSIHFDPAGGQASGLLVVDATSGDSGSPARDRRMHKSILQSDQYGEITFVPDRLEGRLAPEGDSEISLHGRFGIHGEQHELTLKAKVHTSGDQLRADIQFSIPYVQWGMKNPSTLFLRVSDKVNLEIQAVGHVRPASRAVSSR